MQDYVEAVLKNCKNSSLHMSSIAVQAVLDLVKDFADMLYIWQLYL